jgi:leucyl-tRNA synthetase family protein
LAYRKAASVKWCPYDQTVLANEQVTADGRCERCGHLVETRLLEQWFFRITDYAQELLDGLDEVDYPESIGARQRNWIGRSEGAEVIFHIDDLGVDVPVFTTRPDTLFGATFAALAPEHELVERIAQQSGRADEIHEYVRRAALKKVDERAAAQEKTGIDTGLHATNPATGEQIPLFIADYVLTDYGSGAIMAVPAHDQRDFDFAQAFGLPVRQVIRPVDGEVDESAAYVEHTENEVLVNSGEFDGLPADEGGRRIVERLEAEGKGKFAINFRIRDWGFSRQRYWGCPIPVVYCETDGIVPVDDADLPILLPEVEDGGVADPAVRAAHRRGAVAGAGPRAAVGRAVARRRRGAARALHVRAGRAGEREAARPLRGAGRPARGRADRAGEGVAACAGPAERRADPARDRRASQAGQLRRRLADPGIDREVAAREVRRRNEDARRRDPAGPQSPLLAV